MFLKFDPGKISIFSLQTFQWLRFLKMETGTHLWGYYDSCTLEVIMIVVHLEFNTDRGLR